MKADIHNKKFDKMVRLRNILVSAVIFLIIVIFFFVLSILNADKISLGTKIAGVAVGGLSPERAEEKLETATEQYLKTNLTLSYKNSHWLAAVENLGIEIDTETSINAAFQKGHKKGFLDSVWNQFYCALGCNLKPNWRINEEKLEKFFVENISSIHQPAQNSVLIYNEKTKDFDIGKSDSGTVIEKNKFRKDIGGAVNKLQINDIELSLVNEQPEVTESETQEAYKKAKNILANTPVGLFVVDEKEKKEIAKISKEEILSLMDFNPVADPQNPKNKILGVEMNPQKTKDYLVSLTPSINHEPVNAQLTIKNSKVTVFSLSQEGINLDVEKNIPIISEGILNPPADGEIRLEVNKTQPEITTESIDNLGITALLAKGVSNFSGSPKSRIHNIKIGAAKFNGTLIKPEEEFSFNDFLGEVGAEQGYEPELVIKKDKTVPEYGGGLCQVSTTLFRATMNAGLKIIERYPHAFPVKYYNPQGFDATIYPPSPDLKFINNTPSHILIQTKIVGQELIFELYGTNDERRVVIDGPYQYDIKEDGSMKAKITQKVYDKEDDLIIDKTFNSTYKSPALYPVERNPLE